MYQALGRWTSAIDICQEYDRVNLNGAYYKYAKYLQQSGKIENAIQFYGKSDCPLQIAQMLYRNQKMNLLQNYVNVKFLFLIFFVYINPKKNQIFRTQRTQNY